MKPKQQKDLHKKLLTEIRLEYTEQELVGPIHVRGEDIRVQVNTIKKAIRSLKNGKTSGPVGVSE